MKINFKIFILPMIFIVASSNIYAECLDKEDNNINTEQEYNYNVEKNNYFLIIEKNLRKNSYYTVQRLLDEFKAKFPERHERKFYYYSGIVSEFKGEIFQAIQDYQKAIDICPEYSKARINLGCLYLNIGKYIESEDQFHKAIEANPYCPFINYNLGNLYYKLEKYDYAEKYLNQACKYKANYGEAYNKLGLVMYKIKSYSKALDYLDKALKLNYATHETYYYIGLSENKLGRTDMAISNFQKAINLKKDFFPCIVELGNIFRAYKDFKNAIKYYLFAESVNFERMDIRISIAECYYKMKRYNDAIDVIERLLKRDLNNKKLIELLAQIKESKNCED